MNHLSRISKFLHTSSFFSLLLLACLLLVSTMNKSNLLQAQDLPYEDNFDEYILPNTDGDKKEKKKKRTKVKRSKDEEVYPTDEQREKAEERLKGGVLANPDGFETFGEEAESEYETIDPNEPVYAEPDIARKKEKERNKKSILERTREKFGTSSKKEKPSKEKSTATAKSSTSSASKDPDVITVDLSVLYHVALDEQTVKEKPSELSFKEKEDNKYYYNQAVRKLENKDYESAIDFLNRCLDDEPFNKEYLQLRANAYSETQQLKKSIGDYKKAIEVDQEDELLHYNQAATYIKMGKFEEAHQAYTNALKIRPDYLKAIQGRATAKTLLGDYQGAIDDYNLALDENNFFTPAFKGRGFAKSLMSRYDDAIQDFSTCIEIDNRDGVAYYYRGLALISNDQLYRGCSDLDRASQLGVPVAKEDIRELCR